MYRRYSIVYVTDSDDNVLMGQRNDNGLWTNPGGGAHKGECAFECAIREFKEETGVSLDSVKLLEVFFTDDKNLIHMFEGVMPENYVFDTSEDPDLEVEEWFFVDPFDVIDELHVKAEDNRAIKYWAKGK